MKRDYDARVKKKLFEKGKSKNITHIAEIYCFYCFCLLCKRDGRCVFLHFLHKHLETFHRIQ